MSRKLIKWFARFANIYDEMFFYQVFCKAQNSGKGLVGLYHRYRFRRLTGKNSSYVGISAVIMGPPKLPHFLHGIHISRNAKLGTDVTIFQNVTVGGKNGKAPQIGNGVFIGANAVLIGGITVGDGAIIGAGAVVVTDVPAGATFVSPRATAVNRDAVNKA